MSFRMILAFVVLCSIPTIHAADAVAECSRRSECKGMKDIRIPDSVTSMETMRFNVAAAWDRR